MLNSNEMIKIDKKTYTTNENNFHKTKTTKTEIVIGKSLRKDNNHILRLQHKNIGNSKEWNTFTISRDGTIYQHYDDKYYSDFLPNKETNKKSISIVLENMGALLVNESKTYVNYLNEICLDENVGEKTWGGYEFWEKFNEKQINGLVSLCKKLCEEHNIPNECISFHHYNEDIGKFKGITFKSNHIENSSDVNPLFDIQNFVELLSNDEN